MEVLKGSGTSGDVVLNNQVLAKKEGFNDFRIVSDMDIHNIINASKL